MKTNIKKIGLFAAIAFFAALSCAKEEIEPGSKSPREIRTLVCSFQNGQDEGLTKTDITQQGKTVWKSGDKLWVSNGTENDTLTVAAEFDGKKYCELQTKLTGKVYVVYPLSAAKGVDGSGKVQVEVSRIQDGTFGSANISVAVAEDRYVKMKNVTSVLKFRIPAEAKPVKVVSVNSKGNPVSGKCTVDLSTGTPVVVSSETASDLLVKTDGLAGNFYVSVIPGVYSSGFSIAAISIDLNNACEVKTASAENELKVNDLVDLGRIGGELKPLKGDGTEGNPWQISTLPEMLAFTFYVNEGNDMAEQYIKVMENISGIVMPVGSYDEKGDNSIYFKGNFDGGGKTLSLSMNSNGAGREDCLALFGALSDGAYIHDVNIAGSVESSGKNTAGLAAFIKAEKNVLIKNCVSSAKISSQNNAGGILGLSESKNGAVRIENCENRGEISGKYNVGGIGGYAYNVVFSDNKNTAAITSTESAGGIYYYDKDGKKWIKPNTFNRGTGGVCGFLQNCRISGCMNEGIVKGVNKVGGVVGMAYWTPTEKCVNKAEVSSQSGIAGGIVGWAFTASNISYCQNSGEIKGETAAGSIGGIVGFVQPEYNRPYDNFVKACKNTGKVSATGKGAGGIAGYAYSINNKPSRVHIHYCENTGEVSSTADAAGGIVGWAYDWSSWTRGSVEKCLNQGNVTASYYVGGIVGHNQVRTIGGRLDLNNCENRGKILSTKKGDDTGTYIGGLVGYSNGGNKPGCGLRLVNCLNKEEVLYSDPAFVKPMAGGLAGVLRGGKVQNCYNGGRVGLAEGEAAAGAADFTGAVAGTLDDGLIIENVYYIFGAAANVVGLQSTIQPDPASVLSADASGTLSSAVTIEGGSYLNVVDALNAKLPKLDRGGDNYFWKKGPAFSFTGSVDIGNIDLGYGGSI